MLDLNTFDLRNMIGIYPICNTGCVLIHKINYADNEVYASFNGQNPDWYDITEQYLEDTEMVEQGFFMDSLFIPFAGVMRFNNA